MDELSKTLLYTLNDYAKMAKEGNTNVLPAMGRIIDKLESHTGRRVIVSSQYGYCLEGKSE